MSFYSEYLGKDKSLRHYSQHLLLALLTFFALGVYFGDFNLGILPVYIVFSYLEDLDGLFTLILKRNRYRDLYDKGIDLFKKRDLKQLAEFFTKEHKKINRLSLHNFLAYPIVLLALCLSIYFNWVFFVYILSAVITHMTFDLIDDLYQVKNVNNWLWPFKLEI